MAARNKVLFEDLAGELTTGPSETSDSVSARKRTIGYLQERENHLAQLANGEIIEKTLLWVEPERCRLWTRHNRRYDLLNEQRCADLIQGIKAQGRQEFPAIVRRVQGDPQHDFEVICGARRHWAIDWLRRNNYPQLMFLIEVRALTDEEAFRLSDCENREREDISDFERALDYRQALESYYRSQRDMAERLEVSEAWLSRYLDLAVLPDGIIQAYADITELKANHARELKPLLKDPQIRRRILARADELYARQQQALQAGQGLLTGQQILQLLKSAAKNRATKPKQTPLEYRAATGQKMLTAIRRPRGGLLIEVLPRSGANREEVLKAFGDVLQMLAE
ncbi:MAG TPA: ParB/RepB/Spo0J family partition protein [Candidatus Competibacteraceae bacterium]|nr:ParB/RepB/Spo0J family partition protein [Candidatus Competibacteraceae bacterium]